MLVAGALAAVSAAAAVAAVAASIGGVVSLAEEKVVEEMGGAAA
jgi:hypothetical protein